MNEAARIGALLDISFNIAIVRPKERTARQRVGRDMLRTITLCLVAAIVALVGTHLVFRPPSLEGRTVSHAVEASTKNALGRIALTPPDGRAGDSGVTPLLEGTDAFAARIALIRKAEVALDVQYYIWQRDATGLILLDELRRAAERGVRVRLLLDDNGIFGLDGDLAALDALPNVEVRLFNPFILRSPKWVGYAFDFVRLNRRMHNKSLTADGALSIVGGRNIGDIYFGMGEGAHYIDTDVLVAGKVASEVGAEFDRYWASASAHPAERILDAAAAGALAALVADAGAAADSPEGQLYIERLRRGTIIDALRSGSIALEWTTATLVSDDPAKGIGRAEFRDLLFPRLLELLAQPGHSVDLVSSYFIPGRQFTEALASLARSGKRVRILTNSLAATDVTIVHSAYVKYRLALLQGGVELYELKPGFAANDQDRPPDGVGGSSRASLHSKTMAVDERRIFIGSFNFDPRSVRLNTEMGVLVESERIAAGLSRSFATAFPAMSYRPGLNEDGSIYWEETTAGGETIRHQDEPGVTLFSRIAFSVLELLPIEWLL